MSNVNETVTVETVTVAAANNASVVEPAATKPAAAPATSMQEEENDWFSAQNVAALAATGSAVLTMVGKRNCDTGALIGAAAGIGASYLGTKWLTEAMGCQNNGFGKALGLFIGIDLGYGLTNVGINHTENQQSAVKDYL